MCLCAVVCVHTCAYARLSQRVVFCVYVCVLRACTCVLMRDVFLQAYKPAGFPVAWLAGELAFEDVDECIEWLKEKGLTLSADQADIVFK